MRVQYPTNIRIVKVPCTGRVDIIHILKAFESGVDGVSVVGCEEGNCHFMIGNLRARKRIERVQKILDELGIDGKRLNLYNLSAGEGARFVEYVNDMIGKVKELGPSPISGNGK